MISVLICGAKGKMGKKVFECLQDNANIKAVCGIGKKDDFSNDDFPVFDDFKKVNKKIDVIVDFSSPSLTERTLEYALENKIPLCIFTTGIDKTTEKKIITSSKRIPVFYSSNTSVGINSISLILPELSKALNGFDVDIIEKHHRDKKDFPSGTAILLSKNLKNRKATFHSIRAGNAVGEHQIVFSGIDETVTITHQATDRKIFALGAIKAISFIIKKNKGLFDMQDLLKA